MWRKAIDDALRANKAAGVRPDSLRSLAKELERVSGGSPTQESWKSTLARIRRGDQAVTEPVAVKLAAALSVDRSTLPEVRKLRAHEVQSRLEEAEDALAAIVLEMRRRSQSRDAEVVELEGRIDALSQLVEQIGERVTAVEQRDHPELPPAASSD